MPAREHGLNELMVASNFTEEPSSEFTPPVTHYVLDEPKGFDVEFLTNLPAGEYRRDGTPNATVAVAGVTALRLHYVRLLLVAPWTVTVRPEDGYPVAAAEVSLRIPNPASYVVQKLLIHKDRKGKAAKDVLYIHDQPDDHHLVPIDVRDGAGGPCREDGDPARVRDAGSVSAELKSSRCGLRRTTQPAVDASPGIP